MGVEPGFEKTAHERSTQKVAILGIIPGTRNGQSPVRRAPHAWGIGQYDRWLRSCVIYLELALSINPTEVWVK